MSSKNLVLSLFPGIGLLDRAFEDEGFCVVRGPDYLWGGDVRSFHPPEGKFEGVIGGPPCQMFSRLSAIVRSKGIEPKFGNLIPEFERCVLEAAPHWWLMENVPDAPIPFQFPYEGPPLKTSVQMGEYRIHTFLLNNRQCLTETGEPAIQNRVRRWTFGLRGRQAHLQVTTAALFNIDFEFAATGAGKRSVPIAIGGSGKRKRNKVGRFIDRDILSHGSQRSSAGFASVKKLQGLPDDYDLPPFTVAAKVQAIANGVPLPMGAAIAQAVKVALRWQVEF